MHRGEEACSGSSGSWLGPQGGHTGWSLEQEGVEAWGREAGPGLLWDVVFESLLSSALCSTRSTLKLRPGVPTDCHLGWWSLDHHVGRQRSW